MPSPGKSGAFCGDEVRKQAAGDEDMARQQAALQASLAMFRLAVSAEIDLAGEGSRDMWRQRVLHLRSAVRHHFELEERGAFLRVLDTRPTLRPLVVRFREQHRQILFALESLLLLSYDAGRSDELRPEAGHILALIESHEEQELALLSRASS
jgi:hypothetical protein